MGIGSTPSLRRCDTHGSIQASFVGRPFFLRASSRSFTALSEVPCSSITFRVSTMRASLASMTVSARPRIEPRVFLSFVERFGVAAVDLVFFAINLGSWFRRCRFAGSLFRVDDQHGANLGVDHLWFQKDPWQVTEADRLLGFFHSKGASYASLWTLAGSALNAGHAYGETVEMGAPFKQHHIAPAPAEPGLYRTVTGAEALALGLVAGCQLAGLNMFFGSYPITPASPLLHHLARLKEFGITTFQAEDEIAAICAAIGASYAGQLGITSSSGPGVALKTEALGLAVMTELPLVVVNSQRGGPSTGTNASPAGPWTSGSPSTANVRNTMPCNSGVCSFSNRLFSAGNAVVSRKRSTRCRASCLTCGVG